MNRGFTHEASKGASDEWWTPLNIIESLGPFDLDPCGNIRHKTAPVIYDAFGLEKEWRGRVWLNPPYSQVAKWMSKMIEHNYGVALVFARTETRWAQQAFSKCSQVFFPSKRICFLKNGIQMNSPGAPSMFISFNEETKYTMEGTVFYP